MRTLPLSSSLRLLETARKAARFLTEDARDEMASYLVGQMTSDGAFRGRSDAGDLYYTVFGIDALLSLGAPLPEEQIAAYVEGFRYGEGLDLVHLSCLCRCLSRLRAQLTDPDRTSKVLARIEAHRGARGGYGPELGSAQDTVYAGFLAAMAYQDLHVPVPDPDALLRSIQAHRAPEGGYSNDVDVRSGAAPVTSAALMVLDALGHPLDLSHRDWLLDQHCPAGGFSVGPGVSIPDLLSTATALYGLSLFGRPLDDPIREACLAFTEGLWGPGQGFRGHAEDPLCDVEFTFYGLLALGSLLG